MKNTSLNFAGRLCMNLMLNECPRFNYGEGSEDILKWADAKVELDEDAVTKSSWYLSWK